MRHALNLPLFGPLADVGAVVEVAEAAEEAGFDGIFCWDHVLSPVDGDWEIADPWVMHAFWPGNTPAQVLRFIERF